MAELHDVIAQVQAYVATLPGIRKAPTDPPEQINAFPFSVAYPSSGTWGMAPAGSKTGLHNIAIEVHVMRKDLPRDFDKALDYSDILPNLLFLKLRDDNKWNFTIDTFSGISYTFGPMGYGGFETLGFRFIVENVKVQSVLEVLLDSFNDADLTTAVAHKPDFGGPWIKISAGAAAMEIFGNRLRTNGATNDYPEAQAAALADFDLTVKCFLSTVAEFQAIVFRCNGVNAPQSALATGGKLLEISAGGYFRVWGWDSGSFAVEFTGVATDIVAGSELTIRVRAVGGLIKCYSQGNERISYTATAHLANRFVGFQYNKDQAPTQASYFDSLKVTVP